jgi:hypothetical protein
MEEAIRDRQERAALNQSMWREINELALTKRQDNATFKSFVCECAADTCTEEVALTLEEYEAVRRKPNRFFVRPGHFFPDVELVVDDAGTDGTRYQVVDMIGEGALVAAEHDPRHSSVAVR